MFGAEETTREDCVTPQRSALIVVHLVLTQLLLRFSIIVVFLPNSTFHTQNIMPYNLYS